MCKQILTGILQRDPCRKQAHYNFCLVCPLAVIEMDTIMQYVALLYSGDSRCDQAIDPNNKDQYIVWGVGGLGETAFQHFKRASRELIHQLVLLHIYSVLQCSM